MSKFDKAAEAGKGILSLIGKGARKGSEMAIDAYKAPLTQDMIQRGKQGMQGLGDEISALRARAAQPQPTIQELQEELHHIIKRHGQVKVADGLPDGARQQLLDALNEQANDVCNIYFVTVNQFQFKIHIFEYAYLLPCMFTLYLIM